MQLLSFWLFPDFYELNSGSNSTKLGYWFQRRGLCKKVEDSEICAFELLASIAGKLLQESESSASSNASEGNDHPATGKDTVKQERQDEGKPFKAGWIYQGSCGEGSFASEMASQNISHKCLLKEISHADSDEVLERNSIFNNSDCSQKVSINVTDFGKISSKVEGDSTHFRESFGGSINEIERLKGIEGFKTEVANTCSSKDLMELCLKPPTVIKSDSNVELPLCQDPAPDTCFSRYRNDVKLGSRDDDENFSRCFKPSTKAKAFRSPPRVANRRIRKLLTSRHWKVAPKLKDWELSRTGKQVINCLTIVCLIYILCLCFKHIWSLLLVLINDIHNFCICRWGIKTVLSQEEILSQPSA